MVSCPMRRSCDRLYGYCMLCMPSAKTLYALYVEVLAELFDWNGNREERERNIAKGATTKQCLLGISRKQR